MFRLLKWVLFLAVAGGALFVYLSFTGGGEKIRHFGRTVDEKSQQIGRAAEDFRESTIGSAIKMRDKANSVMNTTQGIINGTEKGY